MTEPLVSIIIPHFQTRDLAKLCLRSIRRFTRDIPCELIVIDNASQDGESLEYLRSLPHIRLFERRGEMGTGPQAHCDAVQIGFDAARAPFLLTIHTDTVPIRHDWLEGLLQPMLDNPRVAAVGTDKLKLRSAYQEWLKSLEDWATWWKRQRLVRVMNQQPYIRSHCALYRRSVLESHQLKYQESPLLTAGHGLHQRLLGLGYQCQLLDPCDVIRRVVHLEHATSLMVPELRLSLRKVLALRGTHRLRTFLARPEIQEILQDDSLDHVETSELLVA
jgi:hypothetical protein